MLNIRVCCGRRHLATVCCTFALYLESPATRATRSLPEMSEEAAEEKAVASLDEQTTDYETDRPPTGAR